MKIKSVVNLLKNGVDKLGLYSNESIMHILLFLSFICIILLAITLN